MQKTTRLQRLLAVILAVFMAVCCLPLSAFAEGENGSDEKTLWCGSVTFVYHLESDYGNPILTEKPKSYPLYKTYKVVDEAQNYDKSKYEIVNSNETFKLTLIDLDQTVHVVLREKMSKRRSL